MHLSMISHAIYEVFHQQKNALLLHLLSETTELTHTLIVLRGREDVHALASDLQKEGVAVDSIHGKKKPELIARVMRELKAGVLKMVVVTDASARNLDLDGVKSVMQGDFPELKEDYQARLARVEAEGEGVLYSLATPDDRERLAQVEVLLDTKIQRSSVEGFNYDAKSERVRPTRNKTPKRGPRSKPLQNKKQKWKPKKFGRN